MPCISLACSSLTLATAARKNNLCSIKFLDMIFNPISKIKKEKCSYCVIYTFVSLTKYANNCGRGFENKNIRHWAEVNYVIDNCRDVMPLCHC